MPDAFVPLTVYLQRTQNGAPTAAGAAADEGAPSADAGIASSDEQGATTARAAHDVRGSGATDCGATSEAVPDASAAVGSVCAELALMRFAAAEALEGAARRVLCDLAGDVLGRELALAPCNIDALLRRAVAAFTDLEPVSVRVAAEDAPLLSSATVTCAQKELAALPVRVDPALVSGDFIIEVRDGALESPRAFRLRSTLEGVSTRVPLAGERSAAHDRPR